MMRRPPRSTRTDTLFPDASLCRSASGGCLAHLLKACRRDELGLRDAALLRVAYDAGCRRSELVAILVQHIEKDAQGAGTLFLPSSKTDQAGEGAWAYLSPGPQAAIARWRDKANRTQEPRVWNACVSTCRYRWSPSHLKKNSYISIQIIKKKKQK